MKKLVSTILFAAAVAIVHAQALPIGAAAPAFSLKNVDGTTVSLADYNNEKGVVVVFSCNECPYVKAYEDRMIELHGEFAPKGYPLVLINANDPELSPSDAFNKMQEKAKSQKYPFPYLVDEGQKVLPLYGATRTPELFILKKTGDQFVVGYHGTIDDNSQDANGVEERFAANAIAALLAGETPAPAVTKAIGCAIKVKD